MNLIIRCIVGMLLIVLSTAVIADKYYIRLIEGDKSYAAVESPSSISCPFPFGKVFDKTKKSWRCATPSECASSTESSICDNMARNMVIKSKGSILEYGSRPGYLP